MRPGDLSASARTALPAATALSAGLATLTTLLASLTTLLASLTTLLATSLTTLLASLTTLLATTLATLLASLATTLTTLLASLTTSLATLTSRTHSTLSTLTLSLAALKLIGIFNRLKRAVVTSARNFHSGLDMCFGGIRHTVENSRQCRLVAIGRRLNRL